MQWDHLTPYDYECIWSSSYRANINSQLSASIIGPLGQSDGIYSDGGNFPESIYQRPALYISDNYDKYYDSE